MPSIDYIHSESEMLQVEDHLNLVSQYLIQCLDTENVCLHIFKMDHFFFTRKNLLNKNSTKKRTNKIIIKIK